MDGTLVDTEPYWMAAEEELVESFGGTWTHEDALALVGSGLWESARVFQAAGVDLDADAIVARLTARVQEQLAEHGVPWRPGARELLEALREASVPTALVTMSVRAMADDIVRPSRSTRSTSSSRATRSTTRSRTPSRTSRPPAQLGVDIADCVAIEDSPAGLDVGVVRRRGRHRRAELHRPRRGARPRAVADPRRQVGRRISRRSSTTGSRA